MHYLQLIVVNDYKYDNIRQVLILHYKGVQYISEYLYF